MLELFVGTPFACPVIKALAYECAWHARAHVILSYCVLGPTGEIDWQVPRNCSPGFAWSEMGWFGYRP